MKFFPINLKLAKQFSQPLSIADLSGMLFERTANMEGLQKEFAKLLLLPQKKKEKWVKENQDFIQDMLNTIRHESTIMIQEYAFNASSRKTISDYMIIAQQMLVTLEKVVFSDKEQKLN